MGCKFCAFSVSKNSPDSFKLDADEIAKKAVVAKKLGLTEVTIHGGIHPDVDTHFQVETLNKVNSETSKLGGIYVHAYRITSYNVCYTKLLRLQVLLLHIPILKYLQAQVNFLR